MAEQDGTGKGTAKVEEKKSRRGLFGRFGKGKTFER